MDGEPFGSPMIRLLESESCGGSEFVYMFPCIIAITSHHWNLQISWCHRRISMLITYVPTHPICIHINSHNDCENKCWFDWAPIIVAIINKDTKLINNNAMRIDWQQNQSYSYPYFYMQLYLCFFFLFVFFFFLGWGWGGVPIEGRGTFQSSKSVCKRWLQRKEGELREGATGIAPRGEARFSRSLGLFWYYGWTDRYLSDESVCRSSLSLSQTQTQTPVARLLLSLATDKTLTTSHIIRHFHQCTSLGTTITIHSLFLQHLPFFIYFTHFFSFYYFYLFLIKLLRTNFVNVISD